MEIKRTSSWLEDRHQERNRKPKKPTNDGESFEEHLRKALAKVQPKPIK